MPLAHLTRPYIVPELKCNVLNTILLNVILTGQFCVNTILVKVFPFSSRFSVYVGVHVKLHQDGTMRKMYHAGHDSNMFHIEHDM